MEPNKIDSNVLTYYLQHIHRFLLSQKKIQAFPGVAKDVEEVLIQIAGHDTLFPSQGFDDDCKSILADIKSELIKNKDDYQLSCTFQELRCGTRSLVYTKNSTNVFKQPEPLRKPKSVTSNSASKTNTMTSMISTSFKLRTLNATLKFVKDDNTLSLRYPEMATEQADFIIKMFEQSNSEASIGLGFKTIYASLWEALKIFGLKYKFILRSCEPRDPELKNLVLYKVPIILKPDKEEQDQQSPSSILVTFSTDNNTKHVQSMTDLKNNDNLNTNSNFQNKILYNRDMERVFRKSKLPKITVILEYLGPTYLTDMYRRIHEFVKDPAAASLVFEWLCTAEVQVVCNYNVMANKPSRYKKYFDEEGWFHAMEVFKILLKREFKIKCTREEVRYGGQDGQKKKDVVHNVTYQKIPISEVDKQKSLTRKMRQKQNKLQSKNSSSTTSLNSKASSVENKINEAHLVTKSETNVKENENTMKPANGANKPPVLNQVKLKLIEGLNQPVNSDIAKRMMLNMGWGGGALGVRGEGITEPITPGISQFLTNRRRTGLGQIEELPTPNTNSPPQYQVKTNDYHKKTLKIMLNLLTTSQTSKTIYLPHSYYKKEKGFVKHIIDSVNWGRRISLENEVHEELVSKIREAIAGGSWKLASEAFGDKCMINIMKTPSQNTNDLPKPTKNTNANTSTGNTIYNNEKLQNNTIDKSNNFCTNLSPVPYNFKNNFLTQMLQFAKQDIKQTTITFSYNLNDDEKKYIGETIESFNKGEVFNNLTSEGIFHNNIVRANCTFKCAFNSNHSIILEKQQKGNIYNKEKNNNNFFSTSNINEYNIAQASKSTDQVSKSSDQLTKNNDHLSKNNDQVNKNRDQVSKNTAQVTNNSGQSGSLSCQVTYTSGQEVEYIFIDGVKYHSFEELETFINLNESDSCDTPQCKNINPFESSINRHLLSLTLIDDIKPHVNNNDHLIKNSDQLKNEEEQVPNYSDQVTENSDQLQKNSDTVSNFENYTESAQKFVSNDALEGLDYDIPVEFASGDDYDDDLLDFDDDVTKDETKDKKFIDEEKFVKLEMGLSEGSVSESSPGKRSSPDTEISNQESKKTKRYVKKISIVPKTYPETEITEEQAREIQFSIRNSIDSLNNCQDLPLLKCKGFKNGTLSYRCYSEKSFYFIEDLFKDTDFKIIYGIKNVKSDVKMYFRINSFYDESSELTLKRLNKYNKDLNVNKWKLIKKAIYNDYKLYLVEIDNISYKYIKESNFSLFAGIDRAQFSHYWN